MQKHGKKSTAELVHTNYTNVLHGQHEHSLQLFLLTVVLNRGYMRVYLLKNMCLHRFNKKGFYKVPTFGQRLPISYY